MDRFLYILIRRFSIWLVLTAIVGVMSLFHGSSQGKIGQSADSSKSNPWSKDYVEPAKGASSGASSSSIGETEARERIRDEEFRRKMLRDMRKEYEQGSADSPSYDGPDNSD